MENTKGVFEHPESDVYFINRDDDEGVYTYCHPVAADTIPALTQIAVACGFATALPDLDFETYSEAGYAFDENKNKWVKLQDNKEGIAAVGSAVYSEHPSTEVLCLAYNLKNGEGAKQWRPGDMPPYDLFNHIANGGLLEAANSLFEYFIWENVCHKRMGWPPLPLHQLRDVLAKARAHSLPGALGKAAKVLGVRDQKLDDGKRLIKKLSIPRTPTAKDPRRRIQMLDPDAALDAWQMLEYNLMDIKAESEVSACLPDLSHEELKVWLLDQEINVRGVHIDSEGLHNCLEIVRQATEKGTAELIHLTGGQVNTVGELDKMRAWVESRGVAAPSLDAAHVDAMLLRDDLPPDVKRVIEIRSSLGAASVKKLHSLKLRLCKDGRIRDILAYCGADRTGRWAGRGPQPQNLPNKGPAVRRCDPVSGCGHHSKINPGAPCPWCSAPDWAVNESEWSVEAVDDALIAMSYRRLDIVELIFGDAIAAVAGCLRGLFVAAPGKDFICSDYSAIEAVVIAELSGEEWRKEVFRTHGKIYEMSAAKITGVPFEEMMRHYGYTDAELSAPDWYKRKPAVMGSHHPTRKKIGKVSELASGFQGGLGAWIQFGADKFMTDEEIKVAIKKWRAESPMIVKFWYGLEEAAVNAVQNPGQCFEYRGITFGCKGDVLYCRLLSGRLLSYHSPRLHPDVTPWGKKVLKLTYMGMDSKTKQWVRLNTYGGKLCENVVQATARDLLAHALINTNAAGYPPVIHIHDEDVSEVDEGTGDIGVFEEIMARPPEWAKGWAIKAAGGWRGKRYRKD